MIKYITTISILLSCAVFTAQKEIKESKIELSPRYSEGKTEKNNVTVVLPVSDKIDVTEKTINTSSTDNKLSQPVKATRMTENKVKTSITIDVQESRSHLDNLLILIEEKEDVNLYGEDLTSTSEYKSLLTEISAFKNKFNTHVEKTGIENCSVKERNYYLSFLKEEGKEDEYKVAISKIK